MLLATCLLRYTATGDVIPKMNVTPAEVAVLRAGYLHLVGTEPVTDLNVVGEVDRSPTDEIQRLKQLYANLRIKKDNKDVNVVDMIFGGGFGVTVPQKFEEVGVQPGGKLIMPETYKPKLASAQVMLEGEKVVQVSEPSDPTQEVGQNPTTTVPPLTPVDTSEKGEATGDKNPFTE
jgi:hypothetical protein